ncbi:substrate-binding periplasmic protein [Nocardioides kongjuensis]|uniref:Polar amino acid transport system substrate-binding protein n=1 Tax=Nocardioides kongjuensis TaxID=349522 RepID=A0A852RAN1_9ACTN|nr:transporter substrate-binding domain-containing protein [Nocardioides kongjuensis]NYD31993.1 polar amino acid transport system substrate-binding protein [Nocardioides kongjuensis]
MNRHHRRALAGSTTVLATVLTLSACTSSETVNKVASDCTPAHDVDTVKEGVLAVAAVDYFPVSVTSDGPFKGTEADMVKDFAKQNCLEVKVVKVDFAGAIPAVDSGRADIAIGGFYRTAERAEVVGLSGPVYVDRLGAISEDGLSSVNQIDGHKVGTVDGYLWTADAKKVFGSDLSVYPSNVEMKADLEAGRIDVALDSFGGAKFVFGDEKDLNIEVLEPDDRIASTKEPAQIGFPFTRGNTSLETALNDAIQGWQADGTLVEILEKYGASTDILDVGEPRLLN